MRPTLHLYTLCWNEVRMLPYFFRHYDSVVDRYFVFDDGSTDGSLELLAAHPRTEVERLRKRADSFVATVTALNNRVWKRSRGRADWVVICNLDEHLFHPDLPDYLRRCKDAGITSIRTEGYQMVADVYPETEGRLCDHLTRGMPWVRMDKLAIFDPDAIREIHYWPGRHRSEPTGRVVFPRRTDVKLLHYKYLGLEFLADRSAELKTGLRERDLERRWGVHYLRKREEIASEFERVYAAASEVPLSPCEGAIEPVRVDRFRLLAALRWWRRLARRWILLLGRAG